MPDWYAEVTSTTGPLDEDQRDHLAAALDAAITHDTDTGRTTATFSTDAPTLRQATEVALRQVREALRAVTTSAEVVALRVITLEQAEKELMNPPQMDLIGSTEGAAILGVTRQRFDQLADPEKGHQDFPHWVAKPARGPVYTRASIEEFNRKWERRRTGRPPGSKSKKTAAADAVDALPANG